MFVRGGEKTCSESDLLYPVSGLSPSGILWIPSADKHLSGGLRRKSSCKYIREVKPSKVGPGTSHQCMASAAKDAG